MAGKKVETRRWTPKVVLVMALLGAAAGGAGLYLAENYSEYFRLPEKLQGLGGNLSPEQAAELQAATAKMIVQNTTLVMGLFGLVLGALLGLGTGWIDHSPAKSVLGFLLGGVLGGAAGAAAGYSGHHLLGWLETSTQWNISLITSATHAAVWAIIGVGIGLATGILVPPRFKNLFKAVGALIGAGIVAGLLYPILAAVIFPNANPDRTIPEGLENRAFWAILASVLLSIALGHTLNRKEVSP